MSRHLLQILNLHFALTGQCRSRCLWRAAGLCLRLTSARISVCPQLTSTGVSVCPQLTSSGVPVCKFLSPSSSLSPSFVPLALAGSVTGDYLGSGSGSGCTSTARWRIGCCPARPRRSAPPPRRWTRDQRLRSAHQQRNWPSTGRPLL